MLGVHGWLPAALLVHAITSVTTLALARRARWCRWITFGGSALASVMTIVVATTVLATGRPLTGVLFAHAASGLVVDYAVTPLSAWFLLVLGILSAPIAIYSVGYLAHAVAPSRTAAVGIGFNVLIAAVDVVFVVNNVIGFLFAWELMTLATAALVAIEHESRTSRRAAYLYLVMSHVGTGALVAVSSPSSRRPVPCRSRRCWPAMSSRDHCARGSSGSSCSGLG